MKKTATTVEKILQKLFKLLEVEPDFDIEYQDPEGDQEGSIDVQIKKIEDAGLLIGRHGETIQALESFLGMAIKQKTGEWTRITVNVGDWRTKQEERLLVLAKQAADRAVSTGEPQSLYNLTPGQRRIIHLALSKSKEVTTESQGEGVERCLVINSKKK